MTNTERTDGIVFHNALFRTVIGGESTGIYISKIGKSSNFWGIYCDGNIQMGNDYEFNCAGLLKVGHRTMTAGSTYSLDNSYNVHTGTGLTTTIYVTANCTLATRIYVLNDCTFTFVREDSVTNFYLNGASKGSTFTQGIGGNSIINICCDSSGNCYVSVK